MKTLRSVLRVVMLVAAVVLVAALIAPEHVIPLALALTSGSALHVAAPGVLCAIGPLALIASPRDATGGRSRGDEENDEDPPEVNVRGKSREAGELRGKANTILDEIRDTSKAMTSEEFKAKKSEYDALNARANMLEDFTGNGEVRRQYGEESPDGLTRVGEEREERSLTRENVMHRKIAKFARDAKNDFGDVRNFLAVATGADNSIEVTPKMRKRLAEAKQLTRAIVGTTGDVSGGEYLLPLTQVASIFALTNVQQGILQRARAYNVPGRTLRIPYLIQDDSAASETLNRPMAGNIANVTIVGEGSTKPARPPKFGQRLITVYKYAAITQVSDELLADDFTGELPAEFVNAVGQQALNAVNEDVTIDGTGSGEPDGALYPAAWNISVARNTGSTIKPDDIFAMYARHTHGPGSVWLASRRTVQALFAMSLTSASLVTFLRDLNGVPEMRILGYPVILTDLLPTLGSTGDLALVNPDFYAFALRQALTVEMDKSIGFIEDLTTYRFVVRAGGTPLNPGKYAYKYSDSSGVDEHSPFVYLHS